MEPRYEKETLAGYIIRVYAEIQRLRKALEEAEHALLETRKYVPRNRTARSR